MGVAVGVAGSVLDSEGDDGNEGDCAESDSRGEGTGTAAFVVAASSIIDTVLFCVGVGGGQAQKDESQYK